MKLKPVELFLALGLAATVTACGGGTETPAEAPATDEAPAAVEEGGEGGEGEEAPAEEGGEGGEGGEG